MRICSFDDSASLKDLTLSRRYVSTSFDFEKLLNFIGTDELSRRYVSTSFDFEKLLNFSGTDEDLGE